MCSNKVPWSLRERKRGVVKITCELDLSKNRSCWSLTPLGFSHSRHYGRNFQNIISPLMPKNSEKKKNTGSSSFSPTKAFFSLLIDALPLAVLVAQRGYYKILGSSCFSWEIGGFLKIKHKNHTQKLKKIDQLKQNLRLHNFLTAKV